MRARHLDRAGDEAHRLAFAARLPGSSGCAASADRPAPRACRAPARDSRSCSSSRASQCSRVLLAKRSRKIACSSALCANCASRSQKRASSDRSSISQRGADVAQRIGLERADQHQRAVLRIEHARQRHRGPVDLGVLHHDHRGLLHLHRQHRVVERDGDLLALAGALALQQREQDALHHVHAGRVVGQRGRVDGDRHRRRRRGAPSRRSAPAPARPGRPCAHRGRSRRSRCPPRRRCAG